MPILEKKTHKVAEKASNSEEETVSLLGALSYLCSPHSHALVSRIVLGGTNTQHFPVPQPCTLLGMRPRLQCCPRPAEEPRGPGGAGCGSRSAGEC